LILAAVVAGFFLLPRYLLPRAAAGPAEGAALLVLHVAGFLVGCACALLGAVSGWMGVRGARGTTVVRCLGLVANAALCVLGLARAISFWLRGW
jgi:hypothetical protein